MLGWRRGELGRVGRLCARSREKDAGGLLRFGPGKEKEEAGWVG
jgi:hypothetical protein